MPIRASRRRAKHARVNDMINLGFLRRSQAGLSGSSTHVHLALLALVGASAVLLLGTALTLTSRGLFGHGHSSFTERLIGPPVSSSTGTDPSIVKRHASSATRVTIDSTGASISHFDHTVGLSTVGAGDAAWQPRANGYLRKTPFGSEAIISNGTRTELYLDVNQRVGLHTWKWHLGDVNAKLVPGGGVSVGSNLTIRPPAIYDAHGTLVTPATARWSLARGRSGTDLLLSLDDTHLSVPYVIDPEIDYGSATNGTLYLTNTTSAYSLGTSGTSPGVTDILANTSPGAALCTASTTGTCPGVRDATGQNTGGANYFMPFVGNKPPGSGAFVAAGSIVKPSTANPFGFIVENAGSASGTVIPAGTWTFTVPTLTSTTSSSVSLYVSAGAWVVTDNGAGAISAIGTQLIDPTTTVTTTDLAASATARTFTNTITASVPNVTLAANQHVLVAFYAVKVTTLSRRLSGYMYLGVNGSGTLGATAVAAATMDTPTPLEIPSAPTSLTTGWVKASAAPITATYATVGTAATDQGRVTFYLCPTNLDCSAGSPTWTGNSTSSVLTNGVAGTATVGTALTNGTSYYLEALGEATDPAAGNAPYSTAIKSPLSSLTTLTADGAAPVDVISLTSPSGASITGNTVYYKGNAAGSFKIHDAPTDTAGSGVASSTFGLLSGGSGFSVHSLETIVGTPADSSTISWSSASGSPTIPVHSTDNVGNVGADTTLTLSLDNTAPSGGTVSVPTYSSSPVTVTTGNFSDAGSGIASNTITRSNGQAPIGGVCPVSGYSGATVVTSPDGGVASGQCYVYTLTGTDNVGNTATAVSSPVLVDTVAPTDAITLTAATGAFQSGTTVWYKGNAAGSFKVRDTVTDSLSGPNSATFGTLTGGSGFSTHTTETISTPAGGPYDSSVISWSTASGAPTLPVHATDAAGNSSTDTTLTLALDNTAPTGGSISVPAYATSTSVTITTGNYTDAGSGIAANVITRSNGQAPIGGVCPAVGTFTGATVVTSPDLGVANGQCYVYTLTGTDNVGNSVSLASSNAVLIDTTAPADAFTLTSATGTYQSGTTLYYKGNAAGSFKVRDTVTDTASGPASATFGTLAGGSGFSTHTTETVSTPSGGPYDSSVISWSSASGAPTLPVHGTDAAGNSSTDTTFTLTLDNTAPTGGSISVPTYATSTSVTITAPAYSDAGSGLAAGSNAITRSAGQAPVAGVCPASGYTGATVVTSPDTTVLDGQCYVYTLSAADHVGNTATAVSSPVLVDTTAPADAVSLTGVTGGVYLNGTTLYYKGDAAGSFKLRDTVTDTASGPASATYGALSGGSGFSAYAGQTVSGSSPYDSSAISWTTASGSPTIPVHSTDGAGNTSGTTTYTLSSDTTAPALAVTAPAANALYGGSVAYPAAWSGTTSDAGSGLATVKVSLKDPTGNYWNGVTFAGTSENLRTASFGSGSWSYDGTSNDAPSSLTTNGTYTVHVVATDNVGNQTSSTFTFTFDNTAPVYATSSLDAAGTHVDLTLTEGGTGLDTSASTPPSAFAVSGATVTGVTYTDATHIRLTLQSRLYGDATPTVGYSPGGLTVAQLVRDLAGNSLGAVSAQPITMSAVPSLAQSTITASPSSITANGSSTSTITVQLKNAAGVNLTGSGGAVALAVGDGSLGAVTDHADGTYTATLTSSTTAHGVSVTGTLDGSALTSSAAVTYAPGPAATLAFGVAPPASVSAGQTMSPSLTVEVLDANGNLVSSSASITLAIGTNPASGTLSGTTTRTASGGVATFNDLSLDKAGAGYTLVASSGSLAGATSTPVTVNPAAASTIAVSAGNAQTATVNTTVATAPAVLITDAYGNPVPGVSVTFATASGGGSVTGANPTSGANGIATVGSWTLGTNAGSNSLTATSGTLVGSPITFTATGNAGPATTIAVNGGDSQSATVGTTVATAPSVAVTDAYGNPVAGVSVTFAVGTGGGSATGLTPTTNAAGVATVGSWTLGTTAGANTLTATSGSLTGSPVTFTATGVADAAASMAVNGGDAQTTTVGSAVATAPSVLVTDVHGNPVQSATVTFSVGSGGGSVTGGSTTTNASGVATVGSWTLGTGAGANTLTVTSAGLASVTINATGTAAAAATIAISTGDNQSATVGTNVALAPAVAVTDAYGNPVAGVPVTFAVASGGGSGTGLSATTAANGIATVGSWALGTAAGANTFTATSGSLSGSPLTFNATGTAGSIDHLVLSPATTSVSADVGTASFTAEGRDVYGNSLGDVTSSTTFTITGGSCTAAACTATSAGAHTVTGTMLGATGTAAQTITAGAATTVSLQSGDNQSATVNTDVATAPTVHVSDQYGNPVGGVSVTFAVASGGGSVTGGSAITAANGDASVGTWKLGTGAGANTLTATATGLAGSPVTFSATGVAATPAALSATGGNNQTATVNTALTTVPSVLVADAYGNPVAGATVTFAVASGGGSATGLSQTTNASGLASVGSWTLGTGAGANTLTADVTGASTVTFTATGTAAAATLVAVAGGDNQSATVGTNVAAPPSVVVTDAYSNPVAGVSVAFALASGGGSATGLSQTTDASGIATVGSWTLGTTAGADTLTASSGTLGGSPLTFHATGTAGAATTLAVAGGDNQSATAGASVSTAPSVLASDAYGNPVSGVSVTFAAASGGGSVTGASATTAANGTASVGSWTLGTTAGANTLTANSTGLATVTFNATGVAGAAGSMAIAGGESQTATVSTAVATAPSVLVTDANGNPVQGVAVTFSIGSGGGAVTGANATTNASGIATAGPWTLGTAAGANTLAATSTGLSSVTFDATGTAGSATTLAVSAGDNQTATVATAVSTAPAVIATDTFGNPVAGVSVTFAVASGGGSAAGLSQTTNVSGVATVGSWTLGTTAGANTLTATSGSLTGSPVTFNAAGVAGSAGAMSVNGGEGQTATVNTTVATAPSVLVTDVNGNPVAGISVVFAIASGGGSVTGGNQVTNASGVATLGSWTLGTAAGANTLSVTSAGLPSVTFHATATAGAAANLNPNAGNNQSATVNTAVGTNPSVLVTDAYGNPVSGITVTFAAVSGGGSGTGLTRITSGAGLATVGSWTLGTTAGANTLTAAASGLTTFTFNATGTPGSATTLAVSAGEGQSATVATNVATAPAAIVTDTYGNGVSGVSVTFAVGAGGGSAAGLSQTSGASGIATVGSWTLGTIAGANTLTAAAAGLTTLTFHATGTAASAATIAQAGGESQSATVNTNVATAPSVAVTDTYGNPVAGVTVSFAVGTGGGSATGLSQTTDASGIAAVGSWKLGTSAGANTLTASSGALGGSPITFHATGVADVATSMAISAGDGQTATVGTAVATAPAVLLSDAYGNPVAGASVTFAVASGGGSVTSGATTTAADGIAGVGSWTLGTGTGANSLTVTSTGLTSVTFNATAAAGAAATIARSGGDNQSATVDTNVSAAPSVKVTDGYGNPVAGISVAFAVASGGGSVTGASATSGADGVATVGSWKLGTTAGPNSLTATSGTLTGSPVTFNATGIAGSAGSLSVNSGESQTTTVGSSVATAPSVLVLDSHGNPVQGVSVTFAVASGGGSVTGGSDTTGADGIATVGSWTLGTTAGANTLSVNSAGLTSVTFHATGAAAAAASITLAAGDNQSATVNTAVATAPAVLVSDAYGNPVSGVPVTFAVGSGGGSTAGASASTDGAGVASVGSWTLGTAAGANTLTAASGSLAGSPVSFHATGAPDSLDHLVLAPAAATVTAGASQSYTAEGFDLYGNSLGDVTSSTAFGIAGGSCIAAVCSATTAGAHLVTGSMIGASGTATLTVQAAAAGSMTVNNGDNQTATANTAVATAPSVVVTDAYGNPVSGVAVSFAIASGGGSVSGAGATTNASGIATVGSWTLGTTAGANTLTASSAGLTTVTLHATGVAGSAAALALGGGDNQSATVDTNVATPPSAEVTDAYGNPVSGVAVSFAVTSGGGSVTGASATSGADGIATVGSWKLGTTAGANTLTATSGSLAGSPVTFHATGVAGSSGSLGAASGDNQTATVGSTVASAPSVHAIDSHGNPVAGLTVTFAVGSGGGSLTGVSQTTDASGIATVGSWTLGTGAGPDTLIATATGFTSATIDATGVAGPATSLSVAGGEGQSATVNTAVATAPSVLVTDAYGNPVSGVAVSFGAASGGGSVTGASATTDTSGVATAGSWKLGTAAGANTLTAAASGLGSVTFHATGTAAAAAALNAVAGDGQSATVNTNVATAPSVVIVDQYGNPVAGAPVTFALGSGGGFATGLSQTTDASGTASVGSWKLGTAAGANTLTATSGSLTGSPITFTATATADTATTLAVSTGDSQSATVGAAVATAPAALVTDQYGNGVAGVAVTFAVATGGGSLTGGSATTNASGIATVGSWTLGTTAGANTLTAASGSLAGSPITFTATGTAGSATAIARSAGDGQTATVGGNVATAPSALVTDTYGNPVSGVSVTFAVATGGGSLTGGSATTNASGVATVGSWTLGTTAGANTLTAASGSLAGSPITFTATGTAGSAATIARSAGDGQTAAAANNVATAPSVSVTDSFGNPVAGSSVTFAVASGGGSVTGGNATTNASGIAAVGSWALGPLVGSNTLTATAGSLTGSPVTFTATATANTAAGIAVSGGDGQSATVNATVTTPPSVEITDAFGNPVSGVSVTFAVATGGGSITGASANTNASGIATVGSWKLGTTVGANTITATSGSLSGSPVTFTATGTAGSATTVALSAGDGQTATVASAVATAPAALVTDQYGNPVAGVAVTFAVATGGGSVTGGSATTDASGVATVGSWTLGTTAGANTLTAASGSLAGSPVTFTATATTGSAAVIAASAGDGQSATVNSSVTTAPAARVTDAYGNPVAGASVTFAVASGGGSATGLTQTTDASGVATVGSWTLGTAAGTNTLTATSGSLAGSPVTFTATGTAGNVDHLVLSPAAVSITAGNTQTYTVEGRDVYNNSLGDVTSSTTLSVDGNPCTGAVCAAGSMGSHTVTGSMLGAVGTATMTVSAGAPAQLVFVTPNSTNLALGATRAFTVAVEDAQGDVLTTDNSTAVTYAVSAGPGNLAGLGTVSASAGTAADTVTASTAGQVTLTASATGLTAASVTFTVDPAPVASIDSAPTDPSTSGAASFTYSANDPAATFECSLDGAAYSACSGTANGSISYSGLTTGSHTFDVRAIGVSATGPAAHDAWIVDLTAPTVALTLPADGSYITTPTAPLAATASDTGTGVSAVDFEYSSTTGATCSTGTWTLVGTDTTSSYGATWTTPVDGAYALRAVAHDGAGHSACDLVHVTVDQTPPTATLVSPAANVGGTITLQATGVADATSGVNSVSFEQAPHGTSSWALIGNGVAQGGGAYSVAFDTATGPDGNYDFRVTVTDVAGNVFQQVVGPIRIDNTPPATTISPVAAYVRGTINLVSSAVDSGSGVATTGFEISPHGAGTWTSVPASLDTTTMADGDYDLRAVATDNVGNVGTSALVTTMIDNTPPTATLSAIARYVRGSLTLNSLTADAGSGLASVSYEVSPHAAATWSTVSSPLDTTTLADGDYDFRVVAVDNAGNTTDSAAQLVTVDNTAPTAQLDSPAAGAITRGAIDLASTVADATSGVASITYRIAPAGTPEATPCDTWGSAVPAHLDTTTLTDGLYDLRVVAVDNAGNGRCSTISTNVRVDNTAPHTTDNAPSGPQNHDVTVQLSPTDSGSGVASTTYSVDGGPAQSGTSVLIPAAGNDGTHTIAYYSTDVAGNQEPTHTVQVVIDTTAPTSGSSSSASFTRGSDVLTDSPTSTISSVEFQYRANTTDPWTSIGTDTDGSNGWSVTWDTTSVPDGTYHLQMIETDAAGNQTVTPLADTTVDNTAPASASVSVSGCAAECSGSVTFNASADASVSGIGAVAFQIEPSGASSFTTIATQTSGFSLTWNSTSVSDGPVAVRVGVTDNAGNGPTYSSPVTITVDNNAPTVSLTAPSAGASSISLGATGSADIASVTYEESPHGTGTWTTIGSASSAPYNVTWSSGSLADGQYDVRVTAIDGGGNTGSDLKTVTIDNTAPTGSITAPVASATVGGPSVALAAAASDSGTGVAQVTYQYRTTSPVGAWTNIAGTTWDTTPVASGNYDLRAEIVDGAGNVTFSGVVPITVDSTPPTLSLTGLAAILSGTVPVDAQVAGATQAVLQVTPTGGSSWTTVATTSSAPFTFNFNTAALTDGQYDIRVVATDAYGNQAISSQTNIRLDNTPPSLVSSNPADGTVLAAGTALSSISLVASETLSAVSSLTFDGAPVLAPPTVSGSDATVQIGTVTPGAHWLKGVLTDTAGKTRNFRVNVTLMPPNAVLDGMPSVQKNAPAGAATTLTSVDSTTTVTAPAGAYTAPSGQNGDWLVLGVTPQPASISPMAGFTMAGPVVDVTMNWNSSNTLQHTFDAPLQIDMADPTGGVAIPATYQNGVWHLIPLLATPGSLPAGQSDGFYRDTAGVHILTRHLTLFALVRDNAPPVPPKDFAAVVAADGLTLRWGPGIDQVLIQNFVLYVDGQVYGHFGPTQYETKLGAFTAGDARTFSVSEITTSGIESAATTPLVAVPTLTGLSADAAGAALAARGLTVGKVTIVASSAPSGTVVAPADVQLLPVGSPVDLQIAATSVPRQAQFILRTAVQKRVRLTSRSIVARVLTTASAKIAATLDGARYRRIQRWSFRARAGATIHTLKLRQQLQPGTYTLYWSGRTADGGFIRTSQSIRVIAEQAKAHTAKPAQIVVTLGTAAKATTRALESVGQTHTATPEQSFALASRQDTSVILVDADLYGVQFVRDLRIVFPATTVLALSRNPATIAAATLDGAVGLPASTSSARLAKIVARFTR
ncbi:MAG TPA: Ig-like domain-containing protein [Gaiellaceae bacterium]|nr:Ig-like domain-containing protein [Gaiellaceae bacterium]